jgi:uncharacterized RDD family membrane protein YckC
MPFCSNCGTEYSEGSEYCSKCWQRIGGVIKKDKIPEMRYAPFGPRFVAWFIDGLLIIVTLTLYYWYILYTQSVRGETVGKNIMKIRIVKENGDNHLGLGTVLMREIIGNFVDWLVFGVGGLYLLIDSKNQALHDKVANTYVIYK